MKVVVVINDWSFQYDVYHLVKSFFPEDDVSIIEKSSFYEGAGDPDDLPDIIVDVNTEDGRIDVKAVPQGDKDKAVNGSESAVSPGRTELKNLIKRLLYNVLSSFTGKELPWGTLSGIRPTKLAYGLVMQGMDDEYIHRFLEDNYYVSPGKRQLAVDIAKREYSLLKEKGDIQDGYSIYVSIPFCPSVCSYCSFSSGDISFYRKIVPDYIEKLKYEFGKISPLMRDRKLYTVYVGGGTPTSLEARELKEVLKALTDEYPVSDAIEFTVEAGRPDTIDREKLDVIRSCGADRISINPQTMNNATLRLIGRGHTEEDIEEAFRLARNEGFDNINMDVIEGLPKEGMAEKEYTLQRIRDLSPDSLTVHSLALKRASKLSTEKSVYDGLTFEHSQDVMDMAGRYAKEMGMEPYYLYRQKNIKGNLENIGFARPGKECFYNMLIMEERQSVIAFGGGGITKFVYGERPFAKRCANVKDPGQYIARIDEMVERKVSTYNVLFNDSRL